MNPPFPLRSKSSIPLAVDPMDGILKFIASMSELGIPSYKDGIMKSLDFK